MLTQILPATNLLLIIVISSIVIHNFLFLNKHRNDKNRLKNENPCAYPLVKPEFYNQPLAQQTYETTLTKLITVVEELKKNG